MHLAKYDANNANVTEKQAWSTRKSWCPVDDPAIPEYYVEHCNTTLLGQMDEHSMVLHIITLRPHSLAHMTTDSNRTVVSCKLTMHLWDAASTSNTTTHCT